jgi:hypothetical protein
MSYDKLMKDMRPAVVAWAALAAAVAFAGDLQNRWYYYSNNFTKDSDVQNFERVASTAAESGFNGVQLACGLETWGRWDDKRKARFEKVKEICRVRSLEIAPALWSAGYGSFLRFDENASAALPYSGVWMCDGRTAKWHGDDIPFPNGGFDEAKPNGFPKDWAWIDGFGKFAFRDADVKHGGSASLRFDCSTTLASKHRHFRVSRSVSLKTNHLYRVSCWIKTEGFTPASSFQVSMLSAKGGGASYGRHGTESSHDWKQMVFTFNSGADSEMRLYVGSWGGRDGKLWVDDVELREVGPAMAVRREGCPVRVRNAATGALLEEGRDYAPIAGAKGVWGAGRRPPLEIAIPEGSSVKPGDRLSVSLYYPAVVANNQHPICMSWRRLDDFMAQSAADVKAALDPKSWFLAMDEIRAGGTCELCMSRNTDMAHILGDFVERERAAIKKVRPDADIYIWADMFYPGQNAHDKYYSCRGTYEGSWNLVPKDIIMCCWSQKQRAEQLKFFSGLGFRTFGGAYYDVDTLDSSYDWNRLCRETPNCVGVMYTTWQRKYELLAPFGRIVTQNLPAPASAP